MHMWWYCEAVFFLISWTMDVWLNKGKAAWQHSFPLIRLTRIQPNGYGIRHMQIRCVSIL